MKACCCPVRIGSFVGLSCALVFSLALGALFWSGGADNFNRRGAEAASLFCTYPESVGGIGITEEFREANVCNNDGDPCMKDGANITADEMMGQVTGGHGFGGLLGSSLILLFIAVLIGFAGVGMKNGMITKISAGLIAFCLLSFTIIWFAGFWPRSATHYEVEAVERQYWAFWKTITCNDTLTDVPEGVELGDDGWDAVVDTRVAGLKSLGVEPLYPMDHADYGPLVLNPLWCSTDPAFGWGWPWEQAIKTGAADTEEECPGAIAGQFSLGFILFFVGTWVLAVPLHAWLVAALWQTANESAKAPEATLNKPAA